MAIAAIVVCGTSRQPCLERSQEGGQVRYRTQLPLCRVIRGDDTPQSGE
ncbi:hypothetical protein LC609_27420 [Nostoc sp. XA013]|nr:hypothetical protein [Nostoc sp. XA013]